MVVLAVDGVYGQKCEKCGCFCTTLSHVKLFNSAVWKIAEPINKMKSYENHLVLVFLIK